MSVIINNRKRKSSYEYVSIKDENDETKKIKIIMNVIIYCRISTAKQSLQAQKFECINYCNKNNYNILSIITEIKSAYKNKSLSKLYDIIENNSNITIIIYSVDRFSRNLNNSYQLIDQLIRKKINIIAIKDNIDLHTPAGRHDFRKRISAAQLESELISERVNNNIKYKKKKKYHIGQTPYGYSIRNKFKIINHKEQKIIKFINSNLYKKFNKININVNIYALLKFLNITDIIEEIQFIEDTKQVTPLFISNLLNKYKILKRNKQWTSSKVLYIYNKSNSILDIDFDKLNI